MAFPARSVSGALSLGNRVHGSPHARLFPGVGTAREGTSPTDTGGKGVWGRASVSGVPPGGGTKGRRVAAHGHKEHRQNGKGINHPCHAGAY